ncbi:MAG TPA: UDP-N-acetylglucosamine 2-epimerase (non-hydrolyzing), partial [Candidatus Eisenbacteria bacterium]|nr:UDP-N-acetylglucosamine 2-epimerase (non-hydrolyzing) [Candidatus Eisenbacteria bacterium]
HPTARIMEAFERALGALAPDLVLVVGDVNSTVACSLVAAQRGIPVGHVEAGLRSFDRTMPEEINRLVTDRVSDLLFVTERSGMENLKREGIPDERVHFTGNTMIDTLTRLLPRIDEARAAEKLGLARKGYAVVTLHRPSNVDTRADLEPLVALLADTAAELPVVFPVHPRTRASLEGFGLWETLASAPGLRALEPQPYTEFLSLVKDAAFVLTDSGGIQEETTFLGVPCITRRRSTERPSTVELGTNVLVGDDLARARAEIARARNGHAKRGTVPPLWDGHCAERIVSVVDRWLGPGRDA